MSLMTCAATQASRALCGENPTETVASITRATLRERDDRNDGLAEILCLSSFSISSSSQITAGVPSQIDFLCTYALCLFLVQVDEGSCRIRGHRLREEIPLRRVAAHRSKSFKMSKCLNSLSNNLQPETAAERHYRTYNGTILPLSLHG